MRGWRKLFLLSVVWLMALEWQSESKAQTVSVTTWHNDNLRTGQNLNETTLTPSSLPSTFGQLCSFHVDGQVYAQPLVVTNVTIQGQNYPSVVLVVTETNMLYAFSGAAPASGPCTLIGTPLSLAPSGQYPADCNKLGHGNGKACQNTIAPYVGVLGTPVIGPFIPDQPHAKWPLYVVTETQDCQTPCSPGNYFHYLHAVDIQSLAEITAAVRVFPPTFNSNQAGLWSLQHIQRPGLLLTPDDYLYIAFSMMDGNSPLPNGSVFRYDTSALAQYNPPGTLQPLYFPTTPDQQVEQGGGVWQDSAGLAYGPDENGTNFLYFNTGNGLYDGASNFGDSFLKVSVNLSGPPPAAWFTPGDQIYRNCPAPNYTDADFGSGGPILTPSTSYWPYLAISGEKEGYIWAMDRGAPSGYNSNNNCHTDCMNPRLCSLQDQGNGNKQTIRLAAWKSTTRRRIGEAAPVANTTISTWPREEERSPSTRSATRPFPSATILAWRRLCRRVASTAALRRFPPPARLRPTRWCGRSGTMPPRKARPTASFWHTTP